MVQSSYAPIPLANGHEIPGIGYGVGTAWYGRSGRDETLITAVKTALAAGYTHLDGAEMYANSESLGFAIADVPRESYYLTTKVGSVGDIRGTLEKALKELGVAHVDLYLIHTPAKLGTDGYPTHEEAWKTMEELKDEGLTKSIGVSNYRISDLEKTLAVARHRPVLNQVEFHPFVFTKALPLQQYMDKEKIALAAYGPTSPVTKFSGTSYDDKLNKVTAAVSERAGKKVEASQVLLHLAATLGAIVITTSSKDWRMKEQLEAHSLPALTEEEIESLKEAPEHKRQFMPHMDA